MKYWSWREWFAAIGLAIAASILFYFVVASASAQTDKYDGECTGNETSGRCSDKCMSEPDAQLYFNNQTGTSYCQVVPKTPTSQNVSQSDTTPNTVDNPVDSGYNFSFQGK